MTSHPRPDFYSVLHEHDAYPQLHSTDSYNVLLDYACDSPNPRFFRAVHRRACKDGMVDEITHQLYVRHLVRQEKATDATSFIRRTYPDDAVPSPILLELVSPPTEKPRTHLVPEEKEYKVGPPKPPPPVNMPALGARVEADYGHAHPLVLPSVRYLRYGGKHAKASNIVVRYIRAMSPEASAGELTYARDLIHELLLLPPATISHYPHPQAAYYSSVTQLFDLHPRLRPTSTTLTLAMEWLRRRQERGYLAYGMLRKWTAKWGDFVEDSRVRRKIASFALDERNIFLTRKMINREYACRKQRLEHGVDEPNAPRPWQQARDDALWQALLMKYQRLNIATKRKFGLADQRLWSSDFINSQRGEAGSQKETLDGNSSGLAQ
ncbi:hypothetical protein FRC04_008850 [Tulasnella sp. 424]|nr:hypothetical protein FRC04_008850 [Tulasnella sp. 424]KAG8973752.1 hypothetical protein FRC05_008171 [Tulasnella sp. 425]